MGLSRTAAGSLLREAGAYCASSLLAGARSDDAVGAGARPVQDAARLQQFDFGVRRSGPDNRIGGVPDAVTRQ